MAIHAKRVTVYPKDMRLARRIRGEINSSDITKLEKEDYYKRMEQERERKRKENYDLTKTRKK